MQYRGTTYIYTQFDYCLLLNIPRGLDSHTFTHFTLSISVIYSMADQFKARIHDINYKGSNIFNGFFSTPKEETFYML